jgi:hypothetical protein
MLETSRFWTNLPCRTLVLTELFIARAGTSPLFLCLNSIPELTLNHTNRILSLLPRAEHLYVSFDHQWTEATEKMIMDALTTAEASLLKIFTFRPGWVSSLPTCLFRGYTPALRRFTFSTSIVPQGWRFANTLESLKLSATPTSASDLIACLSELPLLTDLDFHTLDSFPHDVDDLQGRGLTAVLPRLKTLSIQLEPDNMLFFMQHIEAPSVELLFLTTSPGTASNLEQILHTPLVVSYFERLPHGDLSAYLQVDQDGHHSLGMRVYPGLSLPDEVYKCKPVFRLDILIASETPGIPTALLREILMGLRYPRLRLENVDIRVPGHSKDTWTQLFEGHAQSVRVIRVSNTASVAGFIAAWKDAELSTVYTPSHAPNNPLPDGDRGCYQPSLRLARLSSLCIGSANLSQKTEGGRLVDDLTVALTARAQSARRRLDEIEFEYCKGINRPFCSNLLRIGSVREVTHRPSRGEAVTYGV